MSRIQHDTAAEFLAVGVIQTPKWKRPPSLEAVSKNLVVMGRDKRQVYCGNKIK